MKRLLNVFISMVLIFVIVTSPALSTPVNAANHANYVITTTSNVYIRTGPDTKYSAIGKVSGGALVYVSYKTKNNWGYLPELDGYICLNYAKRATYIGNGSEVLKIYTKSGSNVNMRKGPSTKFGTVKSLPKGTRVYVTYYSGDWSYCSCNIGGKTYKGWVSTQYIMLYA